MAKNKRARPGGPIFEKGDSTGVYGEKRSGRVPRFGVQEYEKAECKAGSEKAHVVVCRDRNAVQQSATGTAALRKLENDHDQEDLLEAGIEQAASVVGRNGRADEHPWTDRNLRNAMTAIKKTYWKPELKKQQALSAVTAAPASGLTGKPA